MYKSIRTAIANILRKRVSPTSLQFRLTVELIALSVISLTGVTVWAGWRMEQTVVNGYKQMLEYVAMRFPSPDADPPEPAVARAANNNATKDKINTINKLIH